MNAKDLAQMQDSTRVGAIKRRMQKPPTTPQKETDEDKEVVNDRKNLGY